MPVLRILAVLGAALLAMGQQKPDFSGEWKLLNEKSDFGGVSYPARMTRIVVHKEPELFITTFQADRSGESTTEVKYTIGGGEVVNTTRSGEVRSKLRWEGDVLVVLSKREVRGMALGAEEKWSLSPDGKTLTQDSSIDTPSGTITMKLIFEKQAPAAGRRPEIGKK
jgi:hypothetical protein